MSKKENKKEQTFENKSEEQKNTAHTEENINNQVNNENEEKSENNEEKDLKAIIEKLEQEKKELNDKFLRLFSDFDNFRKRTAKEKLEISKTAGVNVIKDLLTVMDDFDRAVENNKKSNDIEAIKEGFNLIHNKFASILKSKGLSEIESKGETFDVDKHEAVTKVPAPTEDMKGKVVDVIEKGYAINDNIVRFPKVIVGH